MHLPHRHRRAFTLLEVALATVIGSLVLIAAMGLLVTLERSERSVARRAHESAQLQRARLVMQRAFSSILVSSPASSRRPAVATAVATPTGDGAGEVAAAGSPGAGPSSPRDRGPGSRGRSSPGDDRRSAAAGSGGSEVAGGDAKAAGGTEAAGGTLPMVRPPEDAAPRVILHHDELVSLYTMTVKEVDGAQSLQSPQRLELVLIESPVPTKQADAFVLAHAVRLETKRRGISRAPVEESAQDELAAPPEDDTAPTEDRAASEDWGIRAVRGAFELIPKPDKKARLAPGSTRISAAPALDEYGNPKAWELWWVPLQPRRTIEEVREMGRARAVLEASSYGEPFMIATDLASMRVRMFDDRVRKETFEATIQNQLPAYVEVDVATVSGLTASWLFEVSWATGPETRPRTEDTARNEPLREGAGADRAPAANGKDDAAPPPKAPGAVPPRDSSSTPRSPGWDRGRYRVRPGSPVQDKPRGE